MKIKFRAPLATAIAIAVGLIVLVGYFLPVAGGVRFYLLRTGMVLSAVALLVGVINLLSVHFKKITAQEKGVGYSFALIVSLVVTLAVGILDMVRAYQTGSPIFEWSNWIFTYIQLPVETSLMAVIAVSLTFAATQLLRRKLNTFTVVFFASLCLVLLGTIPFITAIIPAFDKIRAWIIQIPAMAGARGLLLGIALGTIATGIRILTGSDRPYGG